ncbi:hypothetical protein F4809DRAFT_616660 [Biscogniauxia mediterranea]|nr:hypothetical protein F4809DRAFT_616660 [Biscogniauxia mediterranea]
MTYTIVAFIRRKEGITPAEFRAYYDTVHVPLLKSLVGSAFPLSHTRNYVTRTPAGGSSNTDFQKDESSAKQDFVPVVYIGQASDVNYDSITTMIWEDKAAFDRFNQIFSTREVLGQIAEDNKNFVDTSLRLVHAVDEPVTMSRH